MHSPLNPDFHSYRKSPITPPKSLVYPQLCANALAERKGDLARWNPSSEPTYNACCGWRPEQSSSSGGDGGSSSSKCIGLGAQQRAYVLRLFVCGQVSATSVSSFIKKILTQFLFCALQSIVFGAFLWCSVCGFLECAMRCVEWSVADI